MSLYDLKKAVFILDYEGKTLTPGNVKDAWLGSCRNRISWPPEAILADTLRESREYHLRGLITYEDVLYRYGLLIDSIVQRNSFDGPFLPKAHLLVSYVKDDPRLNINPKYIHDRFKAALDDGRSALRAENALREAVYLFQSTEPSPSHRAAFTPDEIGNLFQLCLDNLNEGTIQSLQSLVEVYNTTQDTPAYRDAITPEMAKAAFQFCLDRATNPPEGNNPDFYAGQAILMLRYIIADDRLRSPQGISNTEIQALTQYYESVISKKQENPEESLFRFSERIIASAQKSLEYIRICTIPPSNRDQVANLTSHFNDRTRSPELTMRELFHARECLEALARYPIAEPA